jgi:hypothetical protein
MSTTVYWGSYPFQVFDPYRTIWSDSHTGIYIFCGISPQNRWVALYIGQAADSFRSRILGHEQWTPALLRGATHIHAMIAPRANLDAIERGLIAMYQPMLNIQHRGAR